MELSGLYHSSLPEFLLRAAECPEMQRLKDVGMNCGCEYTSFPRFASLAPYSRFSHSVGVAAIIWHFTGDPAQALSGLFHDIASPVFAHTVDFLNHDYERQESTESRTAEIIHSSKEIISLLQELNIEPDSVTDYHRYPIADNDPPQLSADRLEYSFGNMVNYGFRTEQDVVHYYSDLKVCTNESEQPELSFCSLSAARDFASAALECSRIYVAPEDRYSMQILSELLRHALKLGILKFSDLDGSESHVINLLTADFRTRFLWQKFCALRCVTVDSDTVSSEARIIPAKKRCIDPWVDGCGRLSQIDSDYRNELLAFLALDFSLPVLPVYDKKSNESQSSGGTLNA